MKLWVDDERPMPDGYDIHVKTYEEAIKVLSEGKVTHISLDHDLGYLGYEKNGHDIAKWIEEKAFKKEIPEMTFSIHSQNPVGRRRILQAMVNAENYWENSAN